MLGGGGLDLDLDLDSQAAHAGMSRAHQNGAHPAGNSNRVIASQRRVRHAMGYFTYSCKHVSCTVNSCSAGYDSNVMK